MTFEEHRDFRPVVDELVVYINDVRHGNQLKDDASLENTKTLLQFGIAYDVESAEYWQLVTELLEIVLPMTSDFDTVCNLISLMNHQGIRSDRAMQRVAEFVGDLDSLSGNQLAQFTLLFLSDEMQQAHDVAKDLPRLEEALCKNLDKLSQENYAKICCALT